MLHVASRYAAGPPINRSSCVFVRIGRSDGVDRSRDDTQCVNDESVWTRTGRGEDEVFR